MPQKIIEWQELKLDDTISDNVNGLFTPMGIFKIDNADVPASTYRVFIGRTNFTLTENESNCISTIPGIEMVHIFSRYTFIVAIGQLFNWIDCRTQIEYFLCGSHLNDFQIQNITDDAIRIKVIQTKKEISKYKNWMIYVCPNGNLKEIHSEKLDDSYVKTAQSLHNAVAISSGILLSSDYE